MNIDNMTVKQLLSLADAVGCKSDDTAFEVGKSYLIRTVTLYYTGRIKKITSKELVLEEAAWIADTGRYYDCLRDGKFNEVEPYIEDVIIPRDTIIDATIWMHKLPQKQI